VQTFALVAQVGLIEAELPPLSDAEWGVKAPNAALNTYVAVLTETELPPLSAAQWGVKAPNAALIAHVAALTEIELPPLSAAQWGVKAPQVSTLLNVPCTDYPCTGLQALYKH